MVIILDMGYIFAKNKMEHYDIIIIGAGIAGTGLAYNLSQECPDKSVLVIDKEGVGANAAYGYRNTDKDTVRKYGLKYSHVFDGIKVGTYDKTYITIKRKFYFMDYKKTCKNFINKSKAHLNRETALNITAKILITSKKKYSFDYLVDASGHSLFSRKKLNKKLPYRYWIGKTRIIKSKIKLKNYYHHQFSDGEYLEDLYPLDGKILQGDWQYSKRLDFNSIIVPKKTLCRNLIKNPKIEKTFNVAIPCAHIPPLITKNIVCLGDSFGNAYTSSACGIKPIIESSALLTKAIEENDLGLFQKKWEARFLNNYNKFLASRMDRYHNNKLIKAIKNYPKVTDVIRIMSKYPESFLSIFDNEDYFEMPEEIKQKFPFHQKLFLAINWALIKLDYRLNRN
ncbi:FAD-dependent oxidoreductase [Candidatus Woesearchaeota archaeon]|nr:FAD-dependent oxidoreductase [Candidatus Woesearchaeota archaeon]